MQRTISLKIDLPAEFADYLATCATIFNKYVAWSFDTKSYNKSKAHQELYSVLRKEYPDVPSAIIQSIRDTALESVKALKFKFRPFKKPTSHVRYDREPLA